MIYLKECKKFTDDDFRKFNDDSEERLVIVSDNIRDIERIKQKVFYTRWADILRLENVNGTYIGDKAKIFSVAFNGGAV